MALPAYAGIVASFLAIEGGLALLKYFKGDPEADVDTALQNLVARNQSRALSIEAGEVLGREEVQRKFARFNAIPQRALTQAALTGSEPMSTGPRDTSVLDMVAARMGIDPQQLKMASDPRRAGDMSGMLRELGQSPTGN